VAQRQGAVEGLGVGLFGNFYRGRRVLVTGHTGFKGSWLALWLRQLGADVTGLALAPDTSPSHWDLLKLDVHEHRADIRDGKAVAAILREARPDIVFHLAAQSLVRRSYHVPVESWETNVMGSVNLLEACRKMLDLKAVVFVTTDKCYENKELPRGYTEEDHLGGRDPYSASKASAEFVAASYRDAFFKGSPLIATARAGNVIGGGDWAEDRIIPDLARAQGRGEELIVRSPDAVRPWQHVLEPLAGYLQLGQKLLESKNEFEGPWNFGPDESEGLSVSELLGRLGKDWPLSWKAVPNKTLHETATLKLNSTKARQRLKWKPVLTLDQQLKMTAEWYRAFQENGAVLSSEQLKAYIHSAEKAGAAWA